MKHVWKLALLASLAAAPAAAQGQQASGDPLTGALKRQFDGVSRNVKEAAEKMPEDKFTYQATKDVRTFGGFVGHVANSQFAGCSRAKGETNPNKEDFEKVTGKAALVKAITGSGPGAESGAGAARGHPRGQHEPFERALRESRDLHANQRPRAAVDGARAGATPADSIALKRCPVPTANTQLAGRSRSWELAPWELYYWRRATQTRRPRPSHRPHATSS
jgi:hypothetical protein